MSVCRALTAGAFSVTRAGVADRTEPSDALLAERLRALAASQEGFVPPEPPSSGEDEEAESARRDSGEALMAAVFALREAAGLVVVTLEEAGAAVDQIE
eukprot:1180759-Prorocentrum_minimum.AAC.6